MLDKPLHNYHASFDPKDGTSAIDRLTRRVQRLQAEIAANQPKLEQLQQRYQQLKQQQAELDGSVNSHLEQK